MGRFLETTTIYQIQMKNIWRNNIPVVMKLMIIIFLSWSSCFATVEGSASYVEKPALDIVFSLDNSGSMRANDPGFITKEAVGDYIKGLDDGVRVGMVIFDETAVLIEPLTHFPDEKTRAGFIKSLDKIDFRGQYTNSASGVERAVYELKTNGREAARKIIIFLTDGILDTGDKAQDIERERWLKEDLARECKKAGIRIFSIAFTEKADFRLIQTLASRTDGDYFRVTRPDDFNDIFQKINTIALNKRHAEENNAVGPLPAATVSSPAVSESTSRIPSVHGENLDKSPLKPNGSDDNPADGLETEKTASPPSEKMTNHLALILSGIIFLLGTVVLVMVLKNAGNNKGNSADPAVKTEEGDDTPETVLPQAVLIDVGNIITKDSLTLTLNKKVTQIGRDNGNDVVIPQNTVSSFHAAIEYRDGYFYLEDLRSTNGTKLNNNSISQNNPVRLKSGDRIDFAIHEFRFLLSDQTPFGETIMVSGEMLNNLKKNR